jgi:hypothetical protein
MKTDVATSILVPHTYLVLLPKGCWPYTKVSVRTSSRGLILHTRSQGLTGIVGWVTRGSPVFILVDIDMEGHTLTSLRTRSSGATMIGNESFSGMWSKAMSRC